MNWNELSDDAFRQDASRCDRHGTRLCVAIIDLDDFKLLNDTHGHPAGDRALVHVCALVRKALRPTDRIGRLGGEEFLLLLSDAGLDETVAVMERILVEVLELSVADAGGGTQELLGREARDVRDQGPHLVPIGDVDPGRQRPRDGLRRLRSRLGVDVGDDHGGALRGESRRHGGSDARSCSGDEHRTFREPHA